MRSHGYQHEASSNRRMPSVCNMTRRVESWSLTANLFRGRTISTLLRHKRTARTRSSTFCTPIVRDQIPSGESNVYQSAKTLSRAESHCPKLGEDSEMR